MTLRVGSHQHVEELLQDMDIREKESLLDNIAVNIWQSHDTQFTPTPTWCLVRVLPREHMYGRIIVPDGKQQNKPIHEGIVLQTWHPFTDLKGKIHKSEFKPGDHVCYAHWAGMDCPGWDTRYYRLVAEEVREHRGITRDGVIMGTIAYQQTPVRDELYGILADEHITEDSISLNVIIETILKQYDVVRKVHGSKMVSGA